MCPREDYRPGVQRYCASHVGPKCKSPRSHEGFCEGKCSISAVCGAFWYITSMDERRKIVARILNEFGGRFRPFDNTGDDKKVIAGQFPDVILMRSEPPPNSDILFLMKIETNGDFVSRLSEWQALSSTPSVLYIVVPKSRLDEAKKFVSATGVRARVASYEMENDEVKGIQYE